MNFTRRTFVFCALSKMFSVNLEFLHFLPLKSPLPLHVSPYFQSLRIYTVRTLLACKIALFNYFYKHLFGFHILVQNNQTPKGFLVLPIRFFVFIFQNLEKLLQFYMDSSGQTFVENFCVYGLRIQLNGLFIQTILCYVSITTLPCYVTSHTLLSVIVAKV